MTRNTARGTFPLGVSHQRWNRSLLLFSLCWVHQYSLNPSQEVLFEQYIYAGDIVWSGTTINWRAMIDTPFTNLIDHCYDLAGEIKTGEFTPFDLRTDAGWLSREIFLAGLQERRVKIPEKEMDL